MRLILLLMGLALVAAPGRSFADQMPGDVLYKGMELATLPVKTGQRYDISIVSEKAGLAKIKKAVDFLYKRSPYSAGQIKRLKKHGDIYIIYNPAYPYDSGAVNLKLAAFLPTFYDRTGKDPSKRDFIVFVGRFGIKRSTRVLARTIVHELVGHGIQHLEGRTEYVRVLDLECEARLVEEKFIQDVGFDKRDREVIQFRKAMEEHWCSDFKMDMAKTNPKLLKLWDVRNPNVPLLLKHFRRYTQSMRRNGSRKVVERAKAIHEEDTSARLQRDAGLGKPMAQYLLGLRLLKGEGGQKSSMTAAKWLRKAATQNLAAAQYSYGIMLLKGQGLEVDANAAAIWLGKAADQGLSSAQFALGLMYLRGKGVPVNRAKGAVFMRQAAQQNYAKAKTFLLEHKAVD